MTNDELKARVVDLISNIPDEKLGHFAATIEKVANCYQSSTLRAVLMVQDDVNQTQSIYVINAWKEQASEMLTALADALRRAEKEENGLLN